MPQMSQHKWFSMFILFTIVLILFKQMNFFSFKTDLFMTTKNKIFKENKLNWKW